MYQWNLQPQQPLLQQQQQQKVKNYILCELIGKGAAGQIHRGIDETKKENNIVALKFQQHCTQGEKDCIAYFSPFIFQNIVNHYENFDYQYPMNQFGMIIKVNCTVMDYCNSGDLFQYLNGSRHLLQPSHRKEIIFQIGFGLWELSQLGIIHRDIKPQNIMVHIENNQFYFKICDLGLSKQNSTAQTLNIGTPYYMAPELIDDKNYQKRYDSSVDIWAFGGLIYELYSPQQLFSGYTLQSIFSAVKTKKIDFDLQKNVKEEDIRNLISRMMQIDPDSRPKIDQILNELDPFRFKQQKEKFEKQNKKWFESKNKSDIQQSMIRFSTPSTATSNNSLVTPQQIPTILESENNTNVTQPIKTTQPNQAEKNMEIKDSKSLLGEQFSESRQIKSQFEKTQVNQFLNSNQPLSKNKQENQNTEQIDLQLKMTSLDKITEGNVEEDKKNTTPEQLSPTQSSKIYYRNQETLITIFNDQQLILQICDEIKKNRSKEKVRQLLHKQMDQVIDFLQF